MVFIGKISHPVSQDPVNGRLGQHRTYIDPYFLTVKLLSEIDENVQQLFSQKDDGDHNQDVNSFRHRMRKLGEFGNLIHGIFQDQRIDLCCQSTDKSQQKRPVDHQPVRTDEGNELLINPVQRNGSVERFCHR